MNEKYFSQLNTELSRDISERVEVEVGVGGGGGREGRGGGN